MQVTVKSYEEGKDLHLQGYGVVFDSVDLDGEKFTKDTDFGLDNFVRLPVFYSHNMKEVKGVIGSAMVNAVDDVGILFDIIIDRSNKYLTLVKKLADMGRIGLSTGGLPQGVEKDGSVIKTWNLIEVSVTETPAEFLTLSLSEVKEFNDMLLEAASENVIESETLKSVDAQEEEVVEDKVEKIDIKIGDIEMEDTKVPAVETPAQDENLKNINASIAHIMELLENTKAAKAGYVTADGGTADPEIKSFGDFLVAVRRGDDKRLRSVYKSTKDMGESPGSAGGYLVPTEYGNTLIQVAAMQNEVYSRVQRVPVARESGTYPALDQYFAPSAGSGATAFAGGVTAAFTQPGATFTETQPAFSTLNWRLNKVGGYTEVENELVEDSPFAIEALLRGLFQVAIAARNERNILRGSGVGEPLGILNASAAVGVSDTTTSNFKWDDVGKMYARYKGIGGSPVWIIHPSVWPQIMTMNNSSVTAWQSNLASGPGNMLNGYPVITSEHMPQLGATGSVLLADLSAYVVFEKPGLSIGYSEHVGFTRDVGTWVFKQRLDGKPWLQSAITLSSPGSSYTVAPFVYLVND